METVEMVIRDHIVFDELITNEYLAPVMVSLITKKPEMIISGIVELPKPPVTSIFIALKKANPKNVRFFSQVLRRSQPSGSSGNSARPISADAHTVPLL